MAPIWPFNRKKTGAPKAKPAEEKKVFSYERDQGDAQKEKLERLAARKQQFIDLEMEECTFAPPPRPDRGALPTEPKK